MIPLQSKPLWVSGLPVLRHCHVAKDSQTILCHKLIDSYLNIFCLYEIFFDISKQDASVSFVAALSLVLVRSSSSSWVVQASHL